MFGIFLNFRLAFFAPKHAFFFLFLKFEKLKLHKFTQNVFLILKKLLLKFS